MSESHEGKTHTEETKKKMSESHKGKENKHLKNNTFRKGKFHNDETKKLIGSKSLGRTRIVSDETKLNMSLARKKYWNNKRLKDEN